MLREFTIKINGKYRVFIKYVPKSANGGLQGIEPELLKHRNGRSHRLTGSCQQPAYGIL